MSLLRHHLGADVLDIYHGGVNAATFDTGVGGVVVTGVATGTSFNIEPNVV